MIGMTFMYATVTADANDKPTLDQIRVWFSKWGSSMPLRLEKSENHLKVYEIMAPGEALKELPREIVTLGIKW